MRALSQPRYFFILIIAIALFSFNAFRIINVSFTHDEAVTFWDFIFDKGYRNIFLCDPPTSNNHILNTLLAKLSTQVFNSYSVPALRIGSFIALAIYLFYSARLSLHASNESHIAIPIFILLNLNIYMFEFWALMRGYALSWAFMMMAGYHLTVYFKLSKTKDLYLLLFSCVLAVYANLTLLNLFIALSAVLVLHSLLNKHNVTRIIVSLAITAGVLYLALGHIIVSLIASHQLYYGGDNNVIDDTLMSVIKRSFNIALDSTAWKWIITLIIIQLGIGVYWLISCYKNNNVKTQTGLLLWLLPVIILFSVQLQHSLLGSKLLINRTAIFLYPLLIVPVCYTLVQLSWQGRKITALLYGTAILAVVNFIINTRINDTYDWTYNKHDVTILERIKKDAQAKGRKIKLRTFWMFAPTMRYYVATTYGNWVEPIKRDMTFWDKNTSYDYYYINQKEIEYLSKEYKPDTTINLTNETYVLMKKQ